MPSHSPAASSAVDADLGAALQAALDAAIPRLHEDLAALVAIPSVSASGFAPAEVRRSAEAVRGLLAGHGFHTAQLLEVPADGPGDVAHPAVYAERLDAGPAAPTVLLYAHHDVQPPGAAEDWTTPAFMATVRDGRMYGRGSCDDKGGVLTHVGALAAWLGAGRPLPVNVKVIIEGEEEIGSPHLDALLAAHAERLEADAVVIMDSANWKVGVPAITYLLRGLVDCEVEVRGLDHDLHSGMYGGPVPDPLTGLVKLLAGLTDDTGAVAVPGLADDVREPTPDERRRLEDLAFDEDAFRTEAGLVAGVRLGGDPAVHPLERLWMRPNLTIIGLDAPAVATSSNTLTASARARVSLRLAPGQDPERARHILAAHLADATPWGLATTVRPGTAAGAFVADPTGPAFGAASRALADAYGAAPALIGVGGSIPLAEAFLSSLSQEADAPTPVLLLGVADPGSRMHGSDESLALADFRSACLAEARLFAELAVALGPM